MLFASVESNVLASGNGVLVPGIRGTLPATEGGEEIFFSSLTVIKPPDAHYSTLPRYIIGYTPNLCFHHLSIRH